MVNAVTFYQPVILSQPRRIYAKIEKPQAQREDSGILS